MNANQVSAFEIAAIFPIGILTTALPIAPAGLGIGHVAFDRLYALIGQENGANIFNIYFVSMVAFNLLGSLSYLSIKTKPTNETI